MIIIAVTELEYRKGEAVFRAAEGTGFRCVPVPAAEVELAAAIRRLGARHAIVGVERYTGLLYDALPRGGVLARFGVGHDGIDKPLATTRGILCTNTPGALDDSVAEHALNLMLVAARHTATVATACKQGAWTPQVGRELRNRKLAVIGCGPIGCRVARIAAFGFGMQVVGCELRTVDSAALRRDFGFTAVVTGFADAVPHADFVSLHIPSIPQTRHFLNRERLAMLAPQAWLINTARGAIVDELALFDALADGRLAGAALDVFETEPYQPGAPGKDLRTLANTILTPHVGSSTAEACRRMAEGCLASIVAAERGDVSQMNLVNPDVVGSNMRSS